MQFLLEWVASLDSIIFDNYFPKIVFEYGNTNLRNNFSMMTVCVCQTKKTKIYF